MKKRPSAPLHDSSQDQSNQGSSANMSKSSGRNATPRSNLSKHSSSRTPVGGRSYRKRLAQDGSSARRLSFVLDEDISAQNLRASLEAEVE